MQGITRREKKGTKGEKAVKSIINVKVCYMEERKTCIYKLREAARKTQREGINGSGSVLEANSMREREREFRFVTIRDTPVKGFRKREGTKLGERARRENR